MSALFSLMIFAVLAIGLLVVSVFILGRMNGHARQLPRGMDPSHTKRRRRRTR
ncbi:MAG: hypothetical protein AAFS10_16245 [Myxococcota bacterium]